MNPLVQLLISQAPNIIGLVTDHLRQQNAGAVTSAEVIAAFEELFTQSDARDAFLIAALEAEIAARRTPSLE